MEKRLSRSVTLPYDSLRCHVFSGIYCSWICTPKIKVSAKSDANPYRGCNRASNDADVSIVAGVGPGNFTPRPSRPGEFHPEPLIEPDLSLSTYPARAIH